MYACNRLFTAWRWHLASCWRWCPQPRRRCTGWCCHSSGSSGRPSPPSSWPWPIQLEGLLHNTLTVGDGRTVDGHHGLVLQPLLGEGPLGVVVVLHLGHPGLHHAFQPHVEPGHGHDREHRLTVPSLILKLIKRAIWAKVRGRLGRVKSCYSPPKFYKQRASLL